MLLQLASLIESILSQDGFFFCLKTYHNHVVNGISKARLAKPGQDNVNNIELRKCDPDSSLILTYFVPVKMSVMVFQESYSARATPAKHLKLTQDNIF